jgi:hypothetical protein
MANEFTTLCIRTLKARMEEECPNYNWDTERRLPVSDGTASIDICGEDTKSVLIELEMHRGHPENNAGKLLGMNRRGDLLVLHIFSPYYEVTPRYEQASFCEHVLPGQFSEVGISYKTCRWNLDKFPNVRKACQVLPDSKKDFPPDNEIGEAIEELAKELKQVILQWEIEKTPRSSNELQLS